MKPLGLTPTALARKIGTTDMRVMRIAKGEASVRAKDALWFAAEFGTTAEFWMHMQSAYDLAVERMAAEHGL